MAARMIGGWSGWGVGVQGRDRVALSSPPEGQLSPPLLLPGACVAVVEIGKQIVWCPVGGIWMGFALPGRA